MSDLLSPCVVCGELAEGTRCEDHKARVPAPSSRERGYTSSWDRLSRRARRIQPFCSDCGTTEDLTVDHTPEAWDRHERGLSIRLEDVDVVCRAHNSARGAIRGDRPTWGVGVNPSSPGAAVEPKSQTDRERFAVRRP